MRATEAAARFSWVQTLSVTCVSVVDVESRRGLAVRLRPRLFEVAADAVEPSIDELHRFRTGELACDLDGLVDNHRAGSLRVAEKLGDGAPQNIAVARSHTLHAPMLRMTLDQLVDVAGALGGGSEQIIGKTANIVADFLSLGPECAAPIVWALPAHVGLEEHLQAEFAGFTSSAHSDSRQSPVVSLQLERLMPAGLVDVAGLVYVSGRVILQEWKRSRQSSAS